MDGGNKKPLYRKVNVTAHGVGHPHGGDYRETRGRDTAVGMRRGARRGRDYTPLFRFLLSKVGSPWNEVHSEAVSRLDEEAPIRWLVASRRERAAEFVRVGESTYFSGLYVDDAGALRVVNPDLDEDSLEPGCGCCTHTFNGVPFTRRYRG